VSQKGNEMKKGKNKIKMKSRFLVVRAMMRRLLILERRRLALRREKLDYGIGDKGFDRLDNIGLFLGTGCDCN